MPPRLKVRRRLLVAATTVGLIGGLSTGAAGAALVDTNLSNKVGLNAAVEQCVNVVVPTTTATVNATLKVSAAGVDSTTQSSTTVSTPNRTLRVCVQADADAKIIVDAAAQVGLSGTTVRLNAAVTAETAVKVRVTANGLQVL